MHIDSQTGFKLHFIVRYMEDQGFFVEGRVLRLRHR